MHVCMQAGLGSDASCQGPKRVGSLVETQVAGAGVGSHGGNDPLPVACRQAQTQSLVPLKPALRALIELCITDRIQAFTQPGHSTFQP